MASKKRGPRRAVPPSSTPPAAALGVLSVRIPAKLLGRLRLVSAKRRVAGLAPAAQADIVAEALAAWLRANG